MNFEDAVAELKLASAKECRDAWLFAVSATNDDVNATLRDPVAPTYRRAMAACLASMYRNCDAEQLEMVVSILIGEVEHER